MTAAFYEALRMFPSGAVMIREATEDTVLKIPNPVGEEGEKVLIVEDNLVSVWPADASQAGINVHF